LKTLILGAGKLIHKSVWLSHQRKEYEGEVVRLDINPDVKPDIVHDLRVHPLPFKDKEFDEIHAYHILEHLAQQGDYEFLFNEFNEYYRILKDEGLFFGVVPDVKSMWAWGDPGHTRLFPPQYLMFLNLDEYDKADQDNTDPMTDYRYLLKCNFDVFYLHQENSSVAFILRKK